MVEMEATDLLTYYAQAQMKLVQVVVEVVVRKTLVAHL
jgi:hypothetical protein